MNSAVDITTLKDVLKKKTVRVLFIKKDGTERTMNCTLRKDILPKFKQKDGEDKTTKKINTSILSVWDIENNGYRSFKIDSVIDYHVVEEGYEL